MTLPKLTDWLRFHGTFKADPDKKVRKVAFQIESKDAVSTTNGVDRLPIYITDIQFQAGNQLTGWIPHTQEMLERVSWTHNEWTYVASPHNWNTAENPNPTGAREPKVIENVNKRMFNIVGRGHSVIIIPNYLPEDWNITVLPTGIDLTLYPKDDFDLLRISTNDGVWLPEEEQKYKQSGGVWEWAKERYEHPESSQDISNWENIVYPIFNEHPLHRRYTREFYVDGAKAGSEIKIHATTRIATINGKEIPIVGERYIDINDSKMPIDRRKFMLAPQGSVAIRIEFYKQVQRTLTTYDHDGRKIEYTFKYLEDVGIGFYGKAEMVQWTYGRSTY